MTEAQTLEMLKYAGFALAALAGIWAMLKKTTFEDPQGNKRLTPAGYVAIVFVLGSALVGAGAYGVETLISAEERQATRARADDERLYKERAEGRQLLAIALARANAAEGRARAAKQESLTLSLAAEERARQLALAEDVSRGAAANLARAERALAQIDRVLQPAGIPRFTMVWRVEAPFDLSPQLRARIARASDVARRESSAAPEDREFLRGITPGYDLTSDGRRLDSLSARPGATIFPAPQHDPSLAYATRELRARFVFVAPERTGEVLRILAQDDRRFAGLYTEGDFSFISPGEIELLSYQLDGSYIDFVSRGEPAPDNVVQHNVRTGRLTAIQDFERATLIVYSLSSRGFPADNPNFRRAFVERMQLRGLEVRLAGRSYFFRGSQLRRVTGPDGNVAWVIDRFGSPDR